VDGVSVMVADRLRDRFSVVILPATRDATTLDRLRAGLRVNLELDLVGRLVARSARGARLRPGAFRFLLAEVCGHPTVSCGAQVLDRLDICPIPGPGDRQGTAFHIPVDRAAGTGTGSRRRSGARGPPPGRPGRHPGQHHQRRVTNLSP
jgi:3,4-dihydroxy 2-butanone 4-phosphate synthase